MSSSGALAQGDLQHGQLGVLDAVDQALAQTQQLSLLGLVVHVDTGGILQPDEGDLIASAQGDELVHLDQALTVQLAAHTEGALAAILGVIGVALHGQRSLTVGNNANQQTVNLSQAGDHLGAVAVLVLQQLAAVHQSLDDIVHVVGLLGVAGQDVVQILALQSGSLGLVHTEELQVVGRQHRHVLLDAFQHTQLVGVNLTEEAGLVVVDAHAAGSGLVLGLGLLVGIDDGLSAFLIDVALGVHAAHDAGAAHGHVGLLMGDQDGGADAVVAAASGVGAVNADDDRHASLVQLSIAEEGGAAAATVGVHLLLLVQLNAGAVQHIHQGNAQQLGSVAAAQQVVSLTGNPGAGQLLVIRSNDDSPLAADAAQALQDTGAHNTGLGLVVAFGVVQAVQGAPGTSVDQVHDALHSGQLATLMQGLVGGAGLHHLFDLGMNVSLDGLQFSHVLGRRTESLTGGHGHGLEITRHGIVTHCNLLLYFFSMAHLHTHALCCSAAPHVLRGIAFHKPTNGRRRGGCTGRSRLKEP